MRFARELPGDSPYAPREVLGDEDPRTLARETLGMTRPEFSAAFGGSPTRRAKLRGFERNAAVVLGNVGTMEGLPVPDQALADPEPLVREHAAWALARLRRSAAHAPRPNAPATSGRRGQRRPPKVLHPLDHTASLIPAAGRPRQKKQAS